MAKTKAKYPRSGYWFRCLRTAFRITQAQIAYEAKTCQTNVSNFETGKDMVGKEIITNIHNAFIDLVLERAETYGNKKSHICLNIAKLKFAEYFVDYDTFDVSVWATETDEYDLADDLVWKCIIKWGDWL